MLKRQYFIVAVLVWLIIVLTVSCGNSNEPVANGKLVTEVYIVKAGERLDDISYHFMSKSSVSRDVREFREGIIALNWDTVFADRYPHGLILPGDKLLINYWVEEK
ncbi:hypothetical protein [Sporomusa termitida]|uniref:LysM domain-containing protein n=1 Tax=Sporomusa termitida TaxID=2377 RepID=A0A517DSJ3_9FIRM|nr:hypothetical protein [Sporomusa termitida]QDR80309.1 hypothetical protein SPTER_16320 [Sporomusa termitida]